MIVRRKGFLRMYKDKLLNTHMGKKKDELGCLGCTVPLKAFCVLLSILCRSSSVPPLATFFPPHSRNKMQGGYSYLHPG